jgi:hypothetical protein
VKDILLGNQQTSGAAQASAPTPAGPDGGSGTASIQRPLGEPPESGSDAAEAIAAFAWWHPAEAPDPHTDDGRTEESEQVREPSFEPLAPALGGTPQPLRSETSKPLPTGVLTSFPDATPSARLRTHISTEAPSQLQRTVAPRKPTPHPDDDVLLLDTLIAPSLKPSLPTGRVAVARAAAPAQPRAIFAVLIFIAVCGLSVIYAVGPTASPSAPPDTDATDAPPWVIVAIPPARAAPDSETSPPVIFASSTPTVSKGSDWPPLPEVPAAPRAVAESSAPKPFGVSLPRPLHSARVSRPENHPPAALLEPASTQPQPEDPADGAGRSVPPASSALALPPAPSPAILPVSETAPVRLARSGDVSMAVASPPRPSVGEAAFVPTPRVEASVPPAAAPAVNRLPPMAAPDPRPALPADAQPAMPIPTAAVDAAAAEIDPAVFVRRGRELLAAGEIAAARRFFERAAEAGNAPAATGVGRTYDPLYLHQAARGLRGDPGKAAEWYSKAVVLGDGEAGLLLMRLLAAQTP